MQFICGYAPSPRPERTARAESICASPFLSYRVSSLRCLFACAFLANCGPQNSSAQKDGVPVRNASIYTMPYTMNQSIVEQNRPTEKRVCVCTMSARARVRQSLRSSLRLPSRVLMGTRIFAYATLNLIACNIDAQRTGWHGLCSSSRVGCGANHSHRKETPYCLSQEKKR